MCFNTTNTKYIYIHHHPFIESALFSSHSWDGIFDGTKPTEVPMQSIAANKLLQELSPNKCSTDIRNLMSEDCLRLSVFTPRTSGKLPVSLRYVLN